MKLVVLLVSMFFSGIVYSQNVDYNKIILPEDASEIGIAERLVQLAWENNPANQALIHQAEIAEYDYDLAKWSWLENFTASGNLNEFTINPEKVQEQNPTFTPFFPRYNFGVTISLGTIFLTPAKSKKANLGHEIALEQINQQKLMLRAMVLTRYQDYLMNQRLFDVQNEVTEDEYSEYLLTEQSFKRGDASLSTFKEATLRYNTELTKRITLERDLNVAKIALEELIGVSLEDVQ
ncbi:MAG: TolC family protein [Cyclobacteriaceae bacterium]